MPVLAFFVFNRTFKWRVLFHLDNEPNFCAVAEVANNQVTYLLDKWIPSQLKFVLAFLYKIF